MRKEIFLLILVTFFCSTAIASAAPYIVVDEPELSGAVVLFGDLFQANRLERIIGQGPGVYLVDNEAKKELIKSLPGRVTALAMGDLTGNSQNDLVVGTDGAGALYYYTLNGDRWERGDEPYYLWDAIRHLEVHDLNNDGWSDVVALTDGGEVTIFLCWEGKLYPFWRSPAGEVVSNLQVFDINQDGQIDVVYALRSGYVAILTWDEQEFISFWENYSWGSIDDLLIIADQNAPEWLVITSQKMLYGWRWRNGEVVSSRHFHAAELGEHLFYIPEHGLLSFSQKTGLSLFELQSSAVKELWRLPGVYGREVFYVDSQFFFRDGDYNYYRLAPDSGEWTVLLAGRDITGSVDVLESDGEPFLNLSETAELIGFSVYQIGDWYFLKDNNYLRVGLTSGRIEYNGLVLPYTGRLLEKDGQPYGGSEFFPLFGWAFSVDSARRKLTIDRNWSWWVH